MENTAIVHILTFHFGNRSPSKSHRAKTKCFIWCTGQKPSATAKRNFSKCFDLLFELYIRIAYKALY